MFLRYSMLLCATLFLNFSVFGTNSPIAQNDESFGPEGIIQEGDVSLNDSDADGDELFYSIVTPPQNGILDLNPDGTFTFTPNSLYVGFDYATYQVCDPGGLCDEAEIEFAMIFVNYPPIAENDQFFMIMDNTLNGDVTGNDLEINPEPVFYNTLTEPLNAAAFSFNVNGTFSYTPAPGFTGTDMFIYRMCDPCGACDFATVNIEIVESNPAPIAHDDNAFIPEDNTLNGNVGNNDEDIDGDPLTFEILTLPVNGTITFNSNGTYTYVPTPDYYGPDSFTYQACDPYGQCDDATVFITVGFINDPPIALDDYFSVDEDGSVSGSVADNDFDADDEPLEWMIWIPPSHGDIIWDENTGNFTYTPDPDFFGTDQVTYFILDPCGENDLAILYITVISVNDHPEVSVATGTTNEDTALFGNLTDFVTDVDSEILSFELVTGPVNGEISLNTDGNYSYSPNLNFFGIENIVFRVDDNDGAQVEGTLTINVLAVNDAPVVENETVQLLEDTSINGDVASNDFDVDNEELSYTFYTQVEHGVFTWNVDGTFSFSPAENFFGQLIIAYEACDDEFCVPGILTIEVLAVNDVPIASNLNLEGVEDEIYSGSVAASAFDIEDEELQFEILNSTEVGGEFSMNGDGSFMFIPDQDFFGTVSFVYSACDSENSCAEASVVLEIAPVNDAPLAGDDSFEMLEDGILQVSVVENDLDVDDTELTCSIQISPVNGTAVLSEAGWLSYTPNPDFFGTELIVYSLCDPQDACDQGTIEIVVVAVNDMPVAMNDEFGLLMNTTIEGSVADNDFDVDSDILNYSLLVDAVNGILVFNSDGSFIYTPNTDFIGFEIVEYQLCDDDNACVSAELSIEVVNTNEAPVAANDFYSILEDGALQEDVSLNDVDPNDDNLVFSIVIGPEFGEASISVNGMLDYTPPENFFGTVLIVYEACDQFNECSTAEVVIYVESVNDFPTAVNDSFTIDEDQSLEGSVAFNDFDVDDDDLRFELLSDPVNGEINFNENGSFVYTPFPDFYGSEQLEYEVCDGSNACSTASLLITIAPVNDFPQAFEDMYTTDFQTPVSGNVSLNDFDVDSELLVYTLESTPQGGEIEFNEDGSFVYTPNDGFVGVEELDYVVCDEMSMCDYSLLIIEVAAPNLPPVIQEFEQELCAAEILELNLDLLLSDDQTAVQDLIIDEVQVSEGESILNGHILSYTPIIGGSTEVQINFTVCDQGANSLCAEGSITLTIEEAYIPVIMASTVGDVLCFDDSNGSIELSLEEQEGIINTGSWNHGAEGLALSGLSAGEYTVLISSDQSCAFNLEQSFVVAGPESALTVIGLEALPINDTPGGSSEYSVSGGTEPYEFAWINDAEELISETQELLDLNLTDQSGNYTLTVTDANGCATQEVISVTEIDEFKILNLSIYPNPTLDFLNVSFTNALKELVQVEVLDNRGRMVVSESLAAGSQQIALDLRNVENGLYILRLTSLKSTESRSFIKH